MWVGSCQPTTWKNLFTLWEICIIYMLKKLQHYNICGLHSIEIERELSNQLLNYLSMKNTLKITRDNFLLNREELLLVRKQHW